MTALAQNNDILDVAKQVATSLEDLAGGVQGNALQTGHQATGAGSYSPITLHDSNIKLRLTTDSGHSMDKPLELGSEPAGELLPHKHGEAEPALELLTPQRQHPSHQRFGLGARRVTFGSARLGQFGDSAETSAQEGRTPPDGEVQVITDGERNQGYEYPVGRPGSSIISKKGAGRERAATFTQGDHNTRGSTNQEQADPYEGPAYKGQRNVLRSRLHKHTWPPQPLSRAPHPATAPQEAQHQDTLPPAPGRGDLQSRGRAEAISREQEAKDSIPPCADPPRHQEQEANNGPTPVRSSFSTRIRIAETLATSTDRLIGSTTSAPPSRLHAPATMLAHGTPSPSHGHPPHGGHPAGKPTPLGGDRRPQAQPPQAQAPQAPPSRAPPAPYQSGTTHATQTSTQISTPTTGPAAAGIQATAPRVNGGRVASITFEQGLFPALP